jgi:hypothetical protein
MLLFIIIAIVFLGSVLMLVRAGKLKERHAGLWLFVGLVCIVLAIFPQSLNFAARLVGIEVPANLLFALTLLLVLGVCLHLSLEITTLEDRIRRLAEEVSLASVERPDPTPTDQPSVTRPSASTEQPGVTDQPGQLVDPTPMATDPDGTPGMKPAPHQDPSATPAP